MKNIKQMIFDTWEKSINFAVMIIFLIGAIICFSFIYMPDEPIRLDNGTIEKYNDNWTVYEEGNYVPVEEYFQYIEYDDEDTVQMQNTLPATVKSGDVLATYTRNVCIKIYIDDQLRYEHGYQNYEMFFKVAGSQVNVVELSEQDANKTITIIYERANLNSSFMPSDILIGQKTALTFQLLYNTTPNIVFSLIAAMLGVLFFVYATLLFFKKIRNNHFKRFMYLAAFSILLAIWLASDGMFFQIFSDEMFAYYLASFIAFVLLPIPLSLFVKTFCPRYSKLLNTICFIFMVDFIVSLVLYFTGGASLASTFTITHFLTAFTCVILLGIAIAERVKYKNKDALSIILGFSALAACALTDVIRFYIKNPINSAMFTKIGCLLFIVFISIASLMKSTENLSDKLKFNRFKELVYKDPITQGNTMVKFCDEAKELLKNPIDKKYMVVSLNIVKFKMRNSTYGKKGGDKLLSNLYWWINSQLAYDEVACRISADQYAIFLEDHNDLEKRIVKLSSNLENSLISKNVNYTNLKLECGVYYVKEKRISVSEMIEMADYARLNPNKKTLGNISYHLFNEDDFKAIANKARIEEKVQYALDGNAFMMYLQPKYNVCKNKAIEFEALARFDDNGTIIMPKEFISILEMNGLITKLDLNIFKQACNLIKLRIEERKQVPVITINVSVVEMSIPNFFDQYRNYMKENNIDPKYFVFEFPEEAAYFDLETFNNVAKEIKALGSKVCLDDFGKNNLDISILNKIEVSEIKLDEVLFLNNLTKNEILIDSVIGMAKRLGIDVCCEGIENSSMAELLKAKGVTSIQGFYYYKPLSLKEYEEEF